ncbi:DUF4062 domain-containing protein [Fulvivirgaceae bacterium BMA10]|uniref:DUF4062 domain-containing protein n=1 Tax=Splendidivirga corallicola TaxID=3051826 RepID=A0ABT8KX14_9BACT|nr:DUF4062 domain-containing protein [Fulvivirgaceae bacterium BMA10]
MHFKHDIVFGFTAVENEDSTIDDGWISIFSRYLTLTLEQILRRKPSIQYVNNFSMVSQKLLQESAVLVLVLNNDFFDNADNVEVAERFVQKEISYHDNNLSGNTRLCLVQRTSLLNHKLPAFLKKSDIFDFKNFNADMEFLNQSNETLIEKVEDDFWLAMLDLSKNICNKLIQLGITESKEESHVINQSERAVYLAKTSDDMDRFRERMKRELLRHGYSVFPDQIMGNDITELPNNIGNFLKECDMSIHLVGEEYGSIIQDNRSIVDFQNMIAADHSVKRNSGQGKKSRGKFLRIIWLSPEIEELNERQKLFIENLKRDVEALKEVDVLQIPFEELKAVVKRKLAEEFLEMPTFNEIEEKTKKKSSVYVICDRQDFSATDDICRFLREQGFEVFTPDFDGELTDLELRHHENLKACDGCLVYMNTGSDHWLQTKLSDIIKAPGLGRNRPIQARGIYLPDKKEIDLNNLNINGTVIINGNGALNEKTLEPFLVKLRK